MGELQTVAQAVVESVSRRVGVFSTIMEYRILQRRHDKLPSEEEIDRLFGNFGAFRTAVIRHGARTTETPQKRKERQITPVPENTDNMSDKQRRALVKKRRREMFARDKHQ